MFRIAACLIAILILTIHLQSTSAQPGTAPAAAPAAAPEAKPSRMKLTMQKIKEMKVKWSANKPKMKACKEARAKGLVGDDRWFFMSDCMEKS